MTEEETTSLMIVDDHEMVREGLQAILEESREFEVIGHAADGETAVARALELEPDVIIMDILLPGKSGIDACREIVDALPSVRVLMLTATNAESSVRESVNAGAMGYLQKYRDKGKLLATIRDVAGGEFSIQGDSARRSFVGGERRGLESDPAKLALLSERERETLRLFIRGMSYAEIAERRDINPLTVRNSIYAIQRKLGLGSRQELGYWAAKNRILEETED